MGGVLEGYSAALRRGSESRCLSLTHCNVSTFLSGSANLAASLSNFSWRLGKNPHGKSPRVGRSCQSTAGVVLSSSHCRRPFYSPFPRAEGPRGPARAEKKNDRRHDRCVIGRRSVIHIRGPDGAGCVVRTSMTKSCRRFASIHRKHRRTRRTVWQFCSGKCDATDAREQGENGSFSRKAIVGESSARNIVNSRIELGRGRNTYIFLGNNAADRWPSDESTNIPIRYSVASMISLHFSHWSGSRRDSREIG